MSGLLPVARRWLPRLLAAALLLLAVNNAGPANIWRSLSTADLPSVALAAVMVLPFILARAARWRTILAHQGVAIGLGEASRLYSIGLWLGIVTPGQAGDAIKAWYLRERGVPLAIGLLSCVLDRLFDVLVLATIATTALIVFWPGQGGQWLIGGAIVAGVLVGLLLLARPELRGLVTGLPGLRRLWAPLEARLRRLAWGEPLLATHLSLPALALAIGLTIAGFAVTLSRIYLVFHAVGIDLALLPFLAVASITVFASLVSVAGLGSREVALIALLAPFGYSSEQAVAASFLILFLNLTNLVPGLLAWLGRSATVPVAPEAPERPALAPDA